MTTIPTKIAKIGKYDVLGVIGQGGMGMVYKAVDPVIGRLVAIKMVTTGVSDQPDLLRRFQLEAKSTGNLQHRNIVTLHDLGEHEGMPYLVMEYLEGQSLEQIIKQHTPLSTYEKLSIVIQVCEGLGYAHQHDIIHRDVKPANIIVLKDVVKVVDFGIARLGNERLTRTGQVIGSLYYMSPEQINNGHVDGRSDIYSTTVVLFELLTSALPFKGDDPTSTLKRILSDAAPSLSKYISGYPTELDEVICRGLAKDANERHGSMEDFELDLRRVQENLKREMISDYVATAEAAVEAKQWAEAKDSLRQILKLDRQHRRANELLREVQLQIQKQQLSKRLQDLRTQAESALESHQWNEALACLDEAIKMDTTNLELIELRDSVRRASTRLAESLQRAESAHRIGDLDTAKRAVEDALSIDPGDTTAKALNAILSKEIAERSKRRAYDAILGEAKREIAARHYATALDLLQKAETVDGAAPEVQELTNFVKAAMEQEKRRQALEAVYGEIEDLLNRDQYGPACSRAELALREFPNESGLLKLRDFAEKQRELWTKRLYIESQVATARQLLDEGDAMHARRTLKGALAKYPNEPNLLSFLAIVDAAIASANEQRADAERQARERKRAIDMLLATIRKLAAAEQSLDALAIVEDALRRYPDSDELRSEYSTLRQRLVAEEAERERRREEIRARTAEIALELQVAQEALDSGDVSKALSNLLTAVVRYPDSQQLRSLLNSAQARQEAERDERDKAERERQRRTAAIQSELKLARHLLDSNQTSRALEVLTNAARQYPESSELKSELTLAEGRQELEQQAHEKAEQEARERELAIGIELKFAGGLLDSQETTKALEVLSNALRMYPESVELRAQLAIAQDRKRREQEDDERSAKAAQARNDAISAKLHLSRRLLESEQITAAVRVLLDGIREFPDSPDIRAQLAIAEELRKAQQQSDAKGGGLSTSSKTAENQRNRDNVDDGDNFRATRMVDSETLPPDVPASICDVNHSSIGQVRAEDITVSQDKTKVGGRWSLWKLLPLSLGLLGLIYIYVHSRPIVVQLSTRPEGVNVSVGREGCVTPCDLPLKPGSYMVHAEHPGYQVFEQQIIVTRDAKPLPTFALVPLATPPPPIIVSRAMGTLTVRVNVDGADVLVDGVSKGRTDQRGALTVNVEQGSHVVGVRKEGYATTPPRRVEVQGDSSVIAFDISPVPTPPPAAQKPASKSYLVVKSQPGADVILDLKPAGRIPQDGILILEVTPSEHKLDLSLNGYEPFSTRTTVGAGATTQVIAALSKLAEPKPVAEPPAATLTADSGSIQKGQSVTLTWQTRNSNDVWIEGIGKVEENGSRTLTPVTTTTYRLTARGGGTIASASFTVTVTPPAKASNQGPDPTQKGILEALAKYKDAYESESLEQMKSAWPSMSKAEEQDMKDVFKMFSAVKLRLECQDQSMKISGDDATITCQQAARYTKHGKVQPEIAEIASISLRRSGDSWTIRSINVTSH